MKKKILFMFMLLVLMLTGCSSTKDRIVIYTSMEEDRNQALKEQLKEKFPDKNIVVQYMATGNSAAKIKNEGANVEADIVIDLETAHMANVQDNFADLSDFDTSNVEIISSMFYNCLNLKTIPALDLRSLRNVSSYDGFFGYNNLSNLKVSISEDILSFNIFNISSSNVDIKSSSDIAAFKSCNPGLSIVIFSKKVC